jgi:hypothetical protein
MSLDYELVGGITRIETIAASRSIREITRLRNRYGPGRWRKMKGIATVRLVNGGVHLAELHWYEAHGIGRRKMKIKRLLS